VTQARSKQRLWRAKLVKAQDSDDRSQVGSLACDVVVCLVLMKYSGFLIHFSSHERSSSRDGAFGVCSLVVTTARLIEFVWKYRSTCIFLVMKW
jgi:hypothetical protein